MTLEDADGTEGSGEESGVKNGEENGSGSEDTLDGNDSSSGTETTR